MTSTALKRLAAVSLAALAVLAASGCGPPKYVSYLSIHRDYRCNVPWGWNVITDDDGTTTTATSFLGAFDPDFYLGIPSLTVRWYSYNFPHELRDGEVELYHSADDYIRQMLNGVYGKDRIMETPVHEIQVGDGRKAKHFVVLSGAPVSKNTHFGVYRDPQTGQLFNLRRHAYVLIPMTRGFYVLVYPATRDGYKRYEPLFNELVNSFVALTDGPGGPPAQAPAVNVFSASRGKP